MLGSWVLTERGDAEGGLEGQAGSIYGGGQRADGCVQKRAGQ